MSSEAKRGVGLLEGISILDLADEKASFCTRLLADLGACVIKIEKPGGDPSRERGPFYQNRTQLGESLSFIYNNSNKYGITLNLAHAEGRRLFLRLIKRADVVVESFPPGYLHDLNLDFEVLSQTQPGLILVSVTGFGQYGPRRDFKSCDLVAAAFGGQMYVAGSPSTPPLKSFEDQSYYTASLFAAVSILLALRKRNQRGKGEHIDISLMEAVTATLEHVMIRYFGEQIIAKRQGCLHWNNAFYIFPCKEGFIHLSLFQQWDTLIEWLESEGMVEDLKDEKWQDEAYRQKHLDHIIKVMERWTITHTRKELFEVGQLMRFPWAPVQSPNEVLESPQLREREFFVTEKHPKLGTTLKYPRLPFKLNPQCTAPFKRAPLLGEDNAKIYRKELGITEDEMTRLFSIKAI